MSRINRSHRRNLAFAAVAGIALFGAACGDDGPSADLPSLNDDAGATESASEAGGSGGGSGGGSDMSEADMGRALEEYRDCLLTELPPGSSVEVGMDADGPIIAVNTEQGGEEANEDAEAICSPIIEEMERSFIGDAETIAARTEQSEQALQCLVDLGWGEVAGLTLEIDDATGFLGVDINGDFDEERYVEDENTCLAEAGLPTDN